MTGMLDYVKFYYINLAERADRNASFLKQMKSSDSADGKNVLHVERFNAIRPADGNGALGCCLSHIEVLKQHMQGPNAHLACGIFEDDFVWVGDRNKALEQLDSFFAHFDDKTDKKEKWDVVVLAASNCDFRVRADKEAPPHFARLECCQTTTAYIVHPHYLTTLLANFEESAAHLAKGRTQERNFAIDIHWKSLQKRDTWFVAKPGLGKQMDDYSDIQKRNVKYRFI